MVNKISIVIEKNPDGYSVNFPELESINYQDSSLDEVLNRLKDTLQIHLIASITPQQETTGESILNMVDKFTLDLTEEELKLLPVDGAEEHDHYLYRSPKKSR